MSESMFRNTWVGIAEKSGGHMIAAGIESTVGVIFNASSPQWNSWFAIENVRLGPGLGGSLFGLNVVFALNCPSIFTIDKMDISDWGLNFSLGTNWSGLCSKLSRMGLFSAAKQYRNALKTAKAVEAGQKLAAFGTKNEAFEQMKTCVNYLWNAADIAKSSKPAVFAIDVPGTGVGAEVSLSIIQGKFSLL